MIRAYLDGDGVLMVHIEAELGPYRVLCTLPRNAALQMAQDIFIACHDADEARGEPPDDA